MPKLTLEFMHVMMISTLAAIAMKAPIPDTVQAVMLITTMCMAFRAIFTHNLLDRCEEDLKQTIRDKQIQEKMLLVTTILISESLHDKEELELENEKLKLENEKLKADVARFEYGCERASLMYVRIVKHLSRRYGINDTLVYRA
jgi:hypothetical protein